MNTISVIHPYKCDSLWVFDDAGAGLVQQPFVPEADTIIDETVAGFTDTASGFTLVFSTKPFPGYQALFERQRGETGGNRYHGGELDRDK